MKKILFLSMLLMTFVVQGVRGAEEGTVHKDDASGFYFEIVTDDDEDEQVASIVYHEKPDNGYTDDQKNTYSGDVVIPKEVTYVGQMKKSQIFI